MLQVAPREVIYRVTKIPQYGTLLLSGLPVERFTQDDIDQRRLAYRVDSDFLDEWTRTDLFLFKVSVNDSTNDSAIDEHRLKISITYAALPLHRLHEFIRLQSVVVSCGKFRGSDATNEE